MTTPLASVIVPAHDSEATLGRTLDCLRAQDAQFEYEVIVVDDGSTDHTPEIAAAAGDPVRLIRQERGGASAARNRGYGASRGAALAFCDADCFPEPGWLGAGVRALEHADLVQGHVRADPGAVLGPYDRSLWITHEVGLWETANLFVSRELFARVGGFEDWLRSVEGRPMAEDVWFGWRAKRTGARSSFCAEALLYHAVFPGSPADYVAERRRLRHFPEIVARMPELRQVFLYRRLFLNRRTATLDAALLGAGAALALKRSWPLVASVPYARLVRRRAGPHGRSGARVAAVDVAADLVGAWSLLLGTVRARSAVL